MGNPAGITTARQHLAAELAGVGLSVVDHVPEMIAPPVVIISTGNPWITPDDTFGGTNMRAAFELYVIAGTADNASTLAALERMIETAVQFLGTFTVGAPYMGVANGSVYLTARISTAILYDLIGE